MTKVNGPKNRALVKRLNVNAYPAILYLRDGQMREYEEARSVARLAAFGRKAWRDVKPVPFYRAPNNWFGRVGGLLSRVPGIAEEGYTSLKRTHELGDVSILFLVLMVPVTLGVLCIVAADACVVRAARAESAARRRRAAGLAAAAAGGGGSGATPPTASSAISPPAPGVTSSSRGEAAFDRPPSFFDSLRGRSIIHIPRRRRATHRGPRARNVSPRGVSSPTATFSLRLAVSSRVSLRACLSVRLALARARRRLFLFNTDVS